VGVNWATLIQASTSVGGQPQNCHSEGHKNAFLLSLFLFKRGRGVVTIQKNIEMKFINSLKGKDYSKMSSKEFEDFLFSFFKKFGEVKRQVLVSDRGDGRRGKVDFLVHTPTHSVGIEVDRKTPRIKSAFKLRVLGAPESYILTKDPFSITKV